MSRAPIVGGTPDAAHPAVVAIVERRATCASREDLLCSGTLVGPRAVLTAAHCLADREPDELEVIVGTSIDAPAAIVAVWGAVVHPDYQPVGPPEAQRDLAVLVLASAPAVTPAAWSAAAPAELVAGASLTAVGYGALVGTPPATAGARVAGTAVADELAALGVWTTGGTACGGDSGGALFVATAAGERLVGVLKGSGPACTDRALAIRTDAHAAFLDDALAAAAGASDPARPSIAAAESACADACAVHADCPLGMLCLPDGDASHCGWPDVRTVALGEVCGDGAADCIPVGQGAERTCRRASACAPPANGDVGCCAAGGGDAAAPALVAALVLVLVRVLASGRARAAGRRPRRASCGG